MSDLGQFELLPACKAKRRHCIDGTHGSKCHWATPSGQWCNRATYGNRSPRMTTNIEGRQICELFRLKICTDPGEIQRRIKQTDKGRFYKPGEQQ